jgi:hypothetical protein
MTISRLVLVLFLTINLCNFGCKKYYTTTRQPVFNVDMDTISSTLSKIISCENIEIQGTQTEGSDTVSSELDINIINSNINSKDSIIVKDMGSTIAKVFKQSLENQDQFDYYKIFFVNVTVTHGAFGDLTKREYNSKTFKKGEL